MTKDLNTFKSRLKFYMQLREFNPTSLSRAAGLNITAVRDILEHSGTPSPRIHTVINICSALGITPRQLFPEIEDLYIRYQKNESKGQQ